MAHLLFQYFCYECKLFDDEDKAQFHCDGCGICRIGGRENFFHCVTCNMCLPTHLEGKHKVGVDDVPFISSIFFDEVLVTLVGNPTSSQSAYFDCSA